MCQRHYNAAYIRGDFAGGTRTAHRIHVDRPLYCTVEDCGEPNSVKGYCRKHYRRWLDHGDALYERPARPTVSPRVPANIKSPRALAALLGVSRQRAEQLLNQDKHRARNAVNDAIKRGVIAPPPFCLRCGEAPEKPLHAHHWDYERPLDVGWFCHACHMRIHAEIRARKKASA